MVVFCLWRILKRAGIEYMVSHGYNNKNVLIIGAGKAGLALKQEIELCPGMGLRIIGFLDDFPDRVDAGIRGLVRGKISDFRQVVQRYFVDQVFITLHHDEQVFLRLLGQSERLGVDVRVVPSGYDLISSDFVKQNIGIIPVLQYLEPGKGQRQIGKRLFDFGAALAGCLVLLPLGLVIMILIKWDTPGPVFYLSERYGRNGRRFKMFKFRTMIEGADQMIQTLSEHNEADGPIFKIRHDPRITRMGRILRKYSLDELPQLINVLKGDMSLVGPRPFPIAQIDRADLRQLRRLDFRPGITGLWQIKGRSDVSFQRLLRWDIWYIDNWSFGLDMMILWRTIPAVVNGKGAY